MTLFLNVGGVSSIITFEEMTVTYVTYSSGKWIYLPLRDRKSDKSYS